jgi:hypothetical protein
MTKHNNKKFNDDNKKMKKVYIYIDEKYSLSWNTLFHITHPAVTFLLPFLARRPGHGLPFHLTTTILQILSNSKFSFHPKKIQ